MPLLAFAAQLFLGLLPSLFEAAVLNQPMNRRRACATPPASLLAVSSNPRFLSSATQFATTTPIPAYSSISRSL